MYKVGICGHFAFGRDKVSGQIDKTLNTRTALVNALGEKEVACLDSCEWEKKPLSMIRGCRRLLKNCSNIVMLPSKRGVYVFPFLFEFFNFSKRKKLHYVVIGGWLPEYAEKSGFLRRRLRKIDRIYCEIPDVVNKMTVMGFSNVVYMPNFRKVSSRAEDEMEIPGGEPFRLCTFSRIMKAKGVDKAVEAVLKVNHDLGRRAYTLDIYGGVEPDYEAEFAALKEKFGDDVTYKGIAKGSEEAFNAINGSLAVLFPTTYNGECAAGTVIDAFAAGVPVIATDWKYNSSMIHDEYDGILYDYNHPERLAEILEDILIHPEALIEMKKNCLERARDFDADTVINILLEELV